MTDGADPSLALNRRGLLLAGGGAAIVGASSAGAAARDAAPMTPEAYLARFGAVERIPLWPGRPPGAEGYTGAAPPAPGSEPRSPTLLSGVATPELHVFPSARPSEQGLLVIPGGSYIIVSIGNEGVDVADRLGPMGITVFVLVYRLPGEGWARRPDVPLQDAQRAMRVIRSQAGRFGVDPERLSVLGFSAGGHLTASLITAWDSGVYEPVDAADGLSARPHAAGLIYPVIAMEPPFAHAFSRENLLGQDPSPELIARRSPLRHVGPQTPPTFLAHALDDDAVPADNSLLFLAALREHGRPAEAHLFEEGRHAFGIGRPGTPSAQWPDLFASWLARASVQTR